MKTLKLLLIATVLTLGACAQTPTVPVAVDCPAPRPVPSVLQLKSASTLESLNLRIERAEMLYDNAERQYAESLIKARR